jgi:hypothetical protein
MDSARSSIFEQLKNPLPFADTGQLCDGQAPKYANSPRLQPHKEREALPQALFAAPKSAV